MKRSIWVNLFLLIVFLLLHTSYSLAGLEFSGTIRMELISDPLNFDPSVPNTNPRQNQGSTFLSSFYNMDFTKIGLELKLEDSGVEVYWPFTLAVKSLSSTTTPSFQAYLLADDYLNIPFYVAVNTDYFSYSLNNQPVESELGFNGIMDPLGLARGPNSKQPMLTFKVIGNDLPGNWGMQAYLLFDQKVNCLPNVEQLPMGEEEIGKKILKNGKSVAEHGFVDERASYNLLRLDKKLAGIDIGILYGQKYSNNPSFRLTNEADSDADSLLYWGYLKENIGFDFEKVFANTRWQVAVANSRVQWREYATSPYRQDKPAYISQFYPYDLKGELSGKAGLIKGEINSGKRSYRLDALVVEPSFQTVAAINGQFSTVNLLEPRAANDNNLKRNVYAIFDPVGKLTANYLESSLVVAYLGKRLLRITIDEQGKISSLPVQFRLQGTNIASLGELETKYKSPLTGAQIIKDYNEVCAELSNRGLFHGISLQGLNREYLADSDYLKRMLVRYDYKKETIQFTTNLEKCWRLRSDDFLGEGKAYRGNIAVTFKLPGNSLAKVSLDRREGTYDWDLLKTWDDQIVEQYVYNGWELYFEKKQEFSLGTNRAAMVLAGELVAQKTNLKQQLNGFSTIGYLNLELPWNELLKTSHTFIGTKGSACDSFPSNYLNTTLHQEVTYRPKKTDQTELRLAYTNWPGLGDNNIFAEIIVPKGIGSFSFGYGCATIPSLASFTDELSGSLSLNGIGYPPAESLRGRPWEMWDSKYLYSLRDNKLFPTNTTWQNYFTLRYWISF